MSTPRQLRRLGATALAVSLVIVATVHAGAAPAAPAVAPLRVVSGWVPYWNPQSGPTSIKAIRRLAGSVSLFSYSVRGATDIGRITTLDRSGAMRAAARAARIPIVPSVADATAKGVMAGILADPVKRAAHIGALLDLVKTLKADGLDLDYEGFAFADGSASWPTTKPLWTLFVSELAAALHARAKLLFVTIPAVYAATDARGSGYWVYNPIGIAEYVDRIRFMAYDYSTSRVGPTAPLDWTQRIVDFARANLPVGKVELGAPLYGRDWVTGSSGTCPVGVATSGRSSVRTFRALPLAQSQGVTPQRQSNGEMMFTYTATFTGATPPTTTTTEPDTQSPPGTDGTPNAPASAPASTTAGSTTTCTVTHTVWYPDSGSTIGKLQQALAGGLAGISMFALGYDEPGHFDPVRPIATALPHAAGVDPIGNWEIISPGPGAVRVAGWALDPESNLPIVVDVTVDGVVKRTVLARDRRDDLIATYGANGPYHGAVVDLTVRKGRHKICVVAKGVGDGRATKRLACATLRV